MQPDVDEDANSKAPEPETERRDSHLHLDISFTAAQRETRETILKALREAKAQFSRPTSSTDTKQEWQLEARIAIDLSDDHLPFTACQFYRNLGLEAVS